jgi:hypothetical protein
LAAVAEIRLDWTIPIGGDHPQYAASRIFMRVGWTGAKDIDWGCDGLIRYLVSMRIGLRFGDV